MPLSLAEEFDELIQDQLAAELITSQEVNESLLNESMTQLTPAQAESVNDDATLSLLQHARVVQSERANITIREALNNHGATLAVCAHVLSTMIQNPFITPETRRRAVLDVLSLHNANSLPVKQQTDSPQLSISIQTSDKVNLATILNPSGKR